MIFDLPAAFGTLDHPLAYIEWYTPFTRRDPSVNNLYYVSRSTRGRHANATIVSIEDIYSPCHLIAKCGREIDRSWTSSNVLDRAPAFYVNPYINIATFASSGLYNSY